MVTEVSRRSVVAAAHLLLLLSGGASLIDELLWARVVFSVLGGAHTTEALVLGVFFAAIPLGAAIGSRWVRENSSAPVLWRRYALCEALTALSVVAPVALSRGLMSSDWPGAETVAAHAVLIALLIPGAAVGAVWPLMAALMRAYGGSVGKLYSVNTLGSAMGALLAAFVLLERLGASGGLLVSGATSALLAGLALILSRSGDRSLPELPTISPMGPDKIDESVLWLVGSLSGFLTLAFEVLGARLLVLVAPTTVYGLGLVLAVQLAGMAVGARLVPRLLDRGPRALIGALSLATLAVAWAPFVTSIDSPTAATITQTTLWGIGLRACWTLGPGAIALGVLFPLCGALLSKRAPQRFERLGQLAMLSGIAGFLGAIGVGLVVVPALGLAWSFALVALTAGVAGLYCTYRLRGPRGSGAAPLPVRSEAVRGRIGAIAALLASLFLISRFSPIRLETGERLVAHLEGPMGSAAVIDGADGGRRLVVNGSYVLGDNRSAAVARRFSLVPALLRPEPKRILFVGLGTGISKGAAHQVVAVTGGSLHVAELMPEVVTLSEHFAEWQSRTDAPETLYIGDGRRSLRDSRARYDIVIFDVFLPWLPGAAFLYTEETFSLVEERLSEGGMFALWLPLYQLSPDAFGTIVETFTTVFPGARLMAGGMDASRQVVGLTSAPALLSSEKPHLDFLAKLRRSGVDLTPMLSHPDGLNALDLGDARSILKVLESQGFVRHAVVQRSDKPWVEFEGAKAMLEDRWIREDGFARLLAASEQVRTEGPPTEVARALRQAWREGPRTQARFMQWMAHTERHRASLESRAP